MIAGFIVLGILAGALIFAGGFVIGYSRAVGDATEEVVANKREEERSSRVDAPTAIPNIPTGGGVFPTLQEVRAAYAQAVAHAVSASDICHDVRCRAAGSHRCHNLDCKQHKF